MFAEIRRKLETATRARDFLLAHPSDNPGQIAALEKLSERINRAEFLALQEFSGHLTVSTSVKTKEDRRREVRGLLLVLGGVADAAAIDKRDFTLRLTLPRPKINHRNFLTAAKVAVAQATERKALLLQYGMPEGLVEEVTTALAEYEHAANDKNAGLSAHVGASAELEAVTEEIMQQLHHFDAINRHRFKKDGELFAAWKSASDVVWPHPGKDETSPGPSGPTVVA